MWRCARAVTGTAMEAAAAAAALRFLRSIGVMPSNASPDAHQQRSLVASGSVTWSVSGGLPLLQQQQQLQMSQDSTTAVRTGEGNPEPRIVKLVQGRVVHQTHGVRAPQHKG
jgi:hypothetical protein